MSPFLFSNQKAQKQSFSGLSSLPMFEWCSIPTDDTGMVKGFQISKYPITFAQFQVFLDDPDGYKKTERWTGLKKQENEPGKQEWPIHNHPRENVSWYDATAFCNWLGAKLGYLVRLPTILEWRWAAEGPDLYSYPWGKEFDPRRCNTLESGIGKTTPVDKYPTGASSFGVFDLSGNVWEWCWGNFEWNDKPGGDSDYAGLRGGSWVDQGKLARCTKEGGASPDTRRNNHGFRIAGFPSQE